VTNERRNLPVLPLRETVIFPGVAVPISAGRPGTVAAIQAALDGDRMMFAVCQRENVDEPTPETLYQVGVVVRVVQAQRGRGGLQLLLEAESRALVLAYARGGEGMLEATVRVIDEPDLEVELASDPAFSVLDRELRNRSAELARRRGIPPDALNQLLDGVPSPGGFADLVAFYLDLPAHQEQDLLELFPVQERVRRVLVEVERELVRVEAQEDIQEKVQQELGDKQREMMLREQLKVIHRELGEDDEAGEVDELKERIRALELPESARTEVERELGRLGRTHPQSAEYQVIRTYLESVAELPWSTRTDDRLELGSAERILAAFSGSA
jgi:ATP-dependent Lon protease